MFHILLSGDSLRDLWNAHIYVCLSVKTLHSVQKPHGVSSKIVCLYLKWNILAENKKWKSQIGMLCQKHIFVLNI